MEGLSKPEKYMEAWQYSESLEVLLCWDGDRGSGQRPKDEAGEVSQQGMWPLSESKG